VLLDKNCPGSRTLREPVPEEYPCPSCGTVVEIWSDERARRCPSCQTQVIRASAALPQSIGKSSRPATPSSSPACAGWCAAARECLGAEIYERWLRQRSTESEG